MSAYSIVKGKIISDDGIPHLPRYFVDERIACQIDEEGIADIDYFNTKPDGHYKFFCKSFWGGLRLFLDDGKKAFPLAVTKCELMPFGFSGVWEKSGSVVKVNLTVVHDSIVIEIVPDKNIAPNTSFKLDFYDSYCFVPSDTGDVRYRSPVAREWKPWIFEDNCFQGGFNESTGETSGCIGADFDMTFSVSGRNSKYMLSSGVLQPETRYAVVIAFDAGRQQAYERCQSVLQNRDALLQRQLVRYQSIAEKAPVLKSPYPYLNNFFALAPLYHESLKILEYPGAIRANSEHYWVWGWDGLTSNEAIAYWGDRSFIKDMLNFYRDYADEEKGIANAYSRDMQNIDACTPPAQGMYITLLHLYASHGGEVKEYYDFAKEIFKKICETEVDNHGLCRGSTLFPDYTIHLDETGCDISGFNNTVCYCAVRSMEALACMMQDHETEHVAGAFAVRIEDHFEKILYDSDKKFIASSADAESFEKRQVYSANSVKWENNFCGDLVENISDSCMEFFEEHIVASTGLRPIPKWCHAFDADANQLHCWWPVMGEFFSRLINRCDRTELVERWIGWVSYWTEKLLCPEGISTYFETEAPPFDRWNCLSGTWQAYSLRGWYQAAVHSVVGVDFDGGGMTVYPYSGAELSLEGVHYGDRVFDIQVVGSGRFIDRVMINGHEVVGTHKLPEDIYQSTNKVVIYRESGANVPFYLLGAVGVKLSGYAFDGTAMSVRLHAFGQAKLKIRIQRPVEIYIDEQKTDYVQDENGVVILPLSFRAGSAEKTLTITAEKHK